MIYAQHQRDVFILCRSRDDDLLHRSPHVLLGVIGIGKAAGRLNHNLRAHRFPGQRSRVFLFEYLNGLAIHRNAVRTRGNLVRKVPQNRVILQKVGQRFRIRQIVDCYEVQVRILERSAQNIAANSSEAIDANFDCHVSSVNL